MRIIIKGQELHGCIIDGGSGVNVISETTCHTLGLNQWEPCPFWLRMADTRSVHPIGLIRHLDFTLGGGAKTGDTRRVPNVTRTTMVAYSEY